MQCMKNETNFPYTTRLNIQYPALELIDTPALIAANTDPAA